MERRKKEMAFTSSIFLFVFFPICLLGFFLAHAVEKVGSVFKKLRLSDLFLVGIGLIFYGWASLDGIFWMVGMIFLVFLLGKLIEKVPQKTPARLLAVLCSVLVVTLALIYFKYTGFLVTTINQIFSFSLSVKSIAAPLGVSFITFSAISYFVDIYRQDAKAGNLLDAALYLSFFPKVISGPIALWKDFSVQICWADRKLDTENFLWGLNRMILGFAKKVILADVFGLLISQISGNMSGGIDILTAWGMAFLYMLQIYYDFSGYSDIALGLSALFGTTESSGYRREFLVDIILRFFGILYRANHTRWPNCTKGYGKNYRSESCHHPIISLCLGSVNGNCRNDYCSTLYQFNALLLSKVYTNKRKRIFRKYKND